MKREQVNPAYEAMDALHHGTLSLKSSITEFLIENERLREQQEMFELAVQDSTVLSSCLVSVAFDTSDGANMSTVTMGHCGAGSACITDRLSPYMLV